jgi:hypothetical protein
MLTEMVPCSQGIPADFGCNIAAISLQWCRHRVSVVPLAEIKQNGALESLLQQLVGRVVHGGVRASAKFAACQVLHPENLWMSLALLRRRA